MSPKMNFSDYFKTSIKLMESLKSDYLVIGGIAVGVWGNPRLTEDLDVIIFISKKQIKSVILKAKKLGFTSNEKKVIKQANELGTFIFYYKDFHLDFLIASTELEKNALKRKVKVKIFGKDIFVPSKEDFLLLKVIAGRSIDMLDAEGLALRQKDRIDVKYVEFWARKISDEAEDMRIYNDIRRLLSK